MTTKIAIASTLKPVIDPRTYEKIGRSLALSRLYEVHILGASPSTGSPIDNIYLYPIATINDSLGRLFMPWKILLLLFRIRPQTLIITTHELLIIGTVYKLISGAKLIYDIQENYFFNLLYQNNYPWGLRHILAFYVRFKEVFLAIFINHFLLAERCYADEINFIKQRYTILENKFIEPEIELKKQENSPTELILSGTISKEYGVFDTLQFFKQLSASDCRLTIVGHCPNNQTFSKLINAVKGINNITLKVSVSPVPHQEILSYLGTNSIGLLPYQVNKSTKNKLPTKLFEYIGLGIPVLISNNPGWNKIIERYHAGHSIDFNSPINLTDISRCLSLNKSRQLIDLKEIMWINEESKLLTVVHNLNN